MARYRESDLYEVLYSMGCAFDGEQTATSQIWYTDSGHVFTIPQPVDGYFDADVIDLILSDRWLPRQSGRPQRFEDETRGVSEAFRPDIRG